MDAFLCADAFGIYNSSTPYYMFPGPFFFSPPRFSTKRNYIYIFLTDLAGGTRPSWRARAIESSARFEIQDGTVPSVKARSSGADVIHHLAVGAGEAVGALAEELIRCWILARPTV